MHGLFRADAVRAIGAVEDVLARGRLRPDAEIAAAWNLLRSGAEADVLTIFIRGMSSADSRVRTSAAYYVPVNPMIDELRAVLKQMIRTESEQLAQIHALKGLLQGCGISKELVGKAKFSALYRGLHSVDMTAREAAFAELDALAQR